METITRHIPTDLALRHLKSGEPITLERMWENKPAIEFYITKIRVLAPGASFVIATLTTEKPQQGGA